MSQIMPCQNTLPRASENNYQAFQQQQNGSQPMQTTPHFNSFGNQQGNYMQGPYSQQHLFDPSASIQQQSQTCPGVNPWQTTPANQSNFPIHAHTQPSNYPILPQNIAEQIRSCTNSTTPIFILPSSCHQTTPQQSSTAAMPNGTTTQMPAISSIAPMYYPPPFFPYPFPLPIYESLGLHNGMKGNSQRCGCCAKKAVDYGMNVDSTGNYSYELESEKHHQCNQGADETICTKKNCPSALNLQALVSQLLSMQGILACAATRLVLRKIPGSNITTPMDETMEKAKKSLNLLSKEQLLTESRNGQQVNALINLHMTANPPPNVIPILTLVQLKMNVLKAQVESLLNGKLMENQGVGVEETATMDPMVLALKTDSELREFLTALRQKECDERVNVSFAPYRSQRVIAETRLSNIQSKISQVEAEMDRRRATSLQRTQQFGNFYASTGIVSSQCVGLANGYSQNQTYESPDPFAIATRSPRRLILKPHVGSPCTTYERPRTCETIDKSSTAPDAREKIASTCSDKGSGPDGEMQARCEKKPEGSPERKSSSENCSCEDRTSSDESDQEAKKKLHAKVDDGGKDGARRDLENVEVGTDRAAEATLPGKTAQLPPVEKRDSEMPDSSTTMLMDKEEGTRQKSEVPEKDVAPSEDQENGHGTALKFPMSETRSTEKENDVEAQNAPPSTNDVNQSLMKFRTSKTIWLTENGIEGEERNERDSPAASATEQNQRMFRSSLFFIPRRKSRESRVDQRPSASDERQSRKQFKESNGNVIPRANGSKEKTTDRQSGKGKTSVNAPLSPSNRKKKFK